MPEQPPARRLGAAVTVLVVGEINPDVVILGVPALTFGQKEDLVGPTTMTVGSSVAITACALSRLGTATGIVGTVGDDAFGAFMLAQLSERGVAVDGVRTVVGGRTGSSVILVDAGAARDRQILTDPGVMGDLRASDVQLELAEGLRHLHIGSWFMHTGAVADLPSVLAQARRCGLSTSVDPNDDPAREWDAHLPAALSQVETFFCNESEARGVAGVLGAEPGGGVDEAAQRILARLAPGGTVVLKCGAAGAYAYTATDVAHVQAPSVTVTDTVGAGDTLAAAFLHARLNGQDVPAALRLAVAAGSLSTQRSGGVEGQPSFEQASASAALLPVTVRTSPAPTDLPPGRAAHDKDLS